MVKETFIEDSCYSAQRSRSAAAGRDPPWLSLVPSACRRLQRVVGPLFAYERKPLGMLDRLHIYVYVEFGPVKMTFMGHLDLQELTDRSLSEPRKLLKRHEQLTFGYK